MSSKQGFFSRIGRTLIEGMERSAQRQTRQYLLGMSDEFLEEMGVSRKLLAQGPQAWPWRIGRVRRRGRGASMMKRVTCSASRP